MTKKNKGKRSLITKDNVKYYPLVKVVGDKSIIAMPGRKALELADEEGLDLVIVNEKETIVICKMFDEKKERYKQKKRKKKERTSNKNIMQEIKLGRIDCSDHDMSYRAKNIIKFIEKNCKAKVSVNLPKGRGKWTRKDKGADTLQRFLNIINSVSTSSWVATFESKPKFSGHSWSAIIKATKIIKNEVSIK